MASRLATPLTGPPEEDIDLFQVMAALSDPVRRSMVVQLSADPGRACGDGDYEISKSGLTRHWRVLRDAGVVVQRVDGTRHRNWVRREELDRRFPGLMAMVLKESSESTAAGQH